VSAQASERPARVSRSEPGTYETAELTTELGKTAVADTVVAKVAGIATREMPGVYAMAWEWRGRSGWCVTGCPA
jgi:hypothetical protein